MRKIFRPLVRRGEMNGYPVLLLGSLRAGPKALWDYATGSRCACQALLELLVQSREEHQNSAVMLPHCTALLFVMHRATEMGALTGAALRRPPQDNPKTLNTQLYIQLYEKKLKRFEQFAKLYPECYWVFVGDNGQVRAASHMLNTCLALT